MTFPIILENATTCSYTTPGGCCATLDINLGGTSLDKSISGHYTWTANQMYSSHGGGNKPYFMHWPGPMYLLYHHNRWVIETTLGQADHPYVWEYHEEMCRDEETYICPEDVGHNWVFYDLDTGSSVSQTISVRSVDSKFVNQRATNTYIFKP